MTEKEVEQMSDEEIEDYLWAINENFKRAGWRVDLADAVCASCCCDNNLSADPVPGKQWRGHCSACVESMQTSVDPSRN